MFGTCVVTTNDFVVNHDKTCKRERERERKRSKRRRK